MSDANKVVNMMDYKPAEKAPLDEFQKGIAFALEEVGNLLEEIAHAPKHMRSYYFSILDTEFAEQWPEEMAPIIRGFKALAEMD